MRERWYIILWRIFWCPLYYLAMAFMCLMLLVATFDYVIAREFWEEWRPDWTF